MWVPVCAHVKMHDCLIWVCKHRYYSFLAEVKVHSLTIVSFSWFPKSKDAHSWRVNAQKQSSSFCVFFFWFIFWVSVSYIWFCSWVGLPAHLIFDELCLEPLLWLTKACMQSPPSAVSDVSFLFHSSFSSNASSPVSSFFFLLML